MRAQFNAPWSSDSKHDVTIATVCGTLLYQGDGHVWSDSDGLHIYEKDRRTTIYLPPNGWKLVAIRKEEP